jgi:hypothetical protein
LKGSPEDIIRHSGSGVRNMQSSRLGKRVAIVPAERYSPERTAEFLLSNAIDDAYRKAVREVRKLDLDPDSIPHRRPV